MSFNGSRLLSGLLMFSVMISHGFSQNLDEIFSQVSIQERMELSREGKLIRFNKVEPEPIWFPLPDENRETLERIDRVNSGAMIEVFYTIPGEFDRQDRISLINTFLNISEMDEVRYYNPTHDKWHPIFNSSFAIAGMDDRDTPIDDPYLTFLPRSYEAYVSQYLPPVGRMISRIDISNESELLQVSSSNMTGLNYGILPVISEGNFFFEIRVYFLEDQAIFYGCGGVNFFNPFNIFGDRIDPFFYRFEGIFDHYNSFIRPLAEE